MELSEFPIPRGKRGVSWNKPNLGDITQKWVGILTPFTCSYGARFSASELSRKSGVPQQTASRYLNSLVNSNLIDYTRVGKNKLFYFDLGKQTTKIIFSLLELHKALQFQIGIKEASVVINEILNHCESLIIFGSYASKSHDKESDLDIVILGRHNMKKIKKIKQKQAIELNEHYLSYSEFDKAVSQKKPLAVEIIRNHALFGDISKIIDIFLREKHG